MRSTAKTTRIKRPAKGSTPAPAVATIRRKKKPTVGRLAAPPDDMTPEERERHRQEFADACLGLKEPRWPGISAKFPDADGICNATEKAIRFLNCTNSVNLRKGSDSEVSQFLAGAAMEIVTILAGRAEWCEGAQSGLFDLSRHASSWLVSGIRADWPGAIRKARKCADMPGFVSLDPKIGDHTHAELLRIKQGSEIPAAHRPGQAKSPRDSSSPQHRLVSVLLDYIMSYRRAGKFFKQTGADLKDVRPLVQRMIALDPFGKENWKDWRDLGWEILREFSPGKNVPEHPAFRKGMFLASISTENGEGKKQIWRKVSDAWEQLGKKTDIPPE